MPRKNDSNATPAAAATPEKKERGPAKVYTVTAKANVGERELVKVFTFKSERQATRTKEALGKLFAASEVSVDETLVTTKADDAVQDFVAGLVG